MCTNLIFQTAPHYISCPCEHVCRPMWHFKEIHQYYTTRDNNPLKKMQSLIAVACKLIRVFHVILTKGVDYDASKMLGDIRHPGVADRKAA